MWVCEFSIHRVAHATKNQQEIALGQKPPLMITIRDQHSSAPACVFVYFKGFWIWFNKYNTYYSRKKDWLWQAKENVSGYSI